MSTTLRLTIAQYEAMIASGAFDQIEKRIEFIHGELRETSPVGPIHYDYFAFLTRWSVANSPAQDGNVQIQSAILIGDSMPEPDVMWLRPRRYGFDRPKPEDALLLIEVADSSLRFDSTTKKTLYGNAGIPEYWIVDVKHQTLVRHRKSQDDGFADIESFGVSQTVTPSCQRSAELNVAELFEPAL